MLDRDGRCWRAGPVRLLESIVAAIEAGDDTAAAFARRRLRIDQRLHLVAPFLAFVGTADAAQIVKAAENFREPLQVGIERRSTVLRTCDRARRQQRHDSTEGDDRTQRVRNGHSICSHFATIAESPSVVRNPPNSASVIQRKSASSSLRNTSPETQRAANGQDDEVSALVGVGVRQNLAIAGQCDQPDPEAGFFGDFAMNCILQPFAEFDPATRQRPDSKRRSAGAPDQQELGSFEDCGTDGEPRPVWLGDISHDASRAHDAVDIIAASVAVDHATRQ